MRTQRRQWHPTPSTLAWKIPWAEEPRRLQSMGSQRVRYNWATSFSLFTFMHWRRKWQPTPVFLPGESQGREAWWAAVYGVTQSRTLLKWLSSSSRMRIRVSFSTQHGSWHIVGAQWTSAVISGTQGVEDWVRVRPWTWALKLLGCLLDIQGFPGGSDGKESTCNVGDPGSITGSGRFPGEGNRYPVQYSCLENPMDRGAWWAIVHRIAKSWTWLSY